jgi:hypothetical protein
MEKMKRERRPEIRQKAPTVEEGKWGSRLVVRE